MFVSFLDNPKVLLNPIVIGNNVVEQVKCYKILGVILSNDLKNGKAMWITLLRKLVRNYIPQGVLLRAGGSKFSILKLLR